MRKPSLRAVAAVAIFLIAFIGFQLGVTLTEDGAGQHRSLLMNAYYALSLFVIGGIDIGTPQSGPVLAVSALWFAYFAAPLLAISTLLEAFLRVFTNDRWKLRMLKDHIIIAGQGELVRTYIRGLRRRDQNNPVVVLSREGISPMEAEQLRLSFGALTWRGDLADDFTADTLRIKRAHRILLLGEESLRNYETVTLILDRNPELADKIIMRSERLRFMRAMASTPAAQAVRVFNPYQVAADTLVKSIIHPWLEKASNPVGVVIAGFGRFGQSVLERLQELPAGSIATIALIEREAERRVMVTREQITISNAFDLKVLPGDIAHPGVWKTLEESWDIAKSDTVYMLATSREEDNLRTALWLRHHNQHSLVVARLEETSAFASAVAEQNGLHALSLYQLVEDAISTSPMRSS